MQVNTYLMFQGNCEEAMNFYKDVLGGEFTTMMRFGDAPPDTMEVKEHEKNLVMHCTLEFSGCMIMASDTTQPDFKQGTNYHLSIGADEESATTIFNELSRDGQVAMPFEDAFWGGKFGMLIDQYGVQWMVSSEHKPA